MSKYKEKIKELSDKLYTIKERLTWQEAIPEIKFQSISAIHDIVGKIKKSDDSKASAWWSSKVAVLFRSVNLMDKMAAEINTLQVYSDEQLEEIKNLSEKVRNLEEEALNLYEMLNKKL